MHGIKIFSGAPSELFEGLTTRFKLPWVIYVEYWKGECHIGFSYPWPAEENMATFNLNGKAVTVNEEGEMPLLWAIRDHLKLTGTKFGCGVGACGACTVHIDGVATRSCVTAIEDIEGAEIQTIESLEKDGAPSSVQAAWIAEQVPQCGYCQSGMIMAATALLNENPNPSDEDIDEAMTNICRCGTYPRIKKAIKRAAEMSNG